MFEPDPESGFQEKDDLIDSPVNKNDITGAPWTVPDALLGTVLMIPFSLIAGISIYIFIWSVSRLLGLGSPIYLEIISLGGATFFVGIGLAWWLGIKRRGGTAANLGWTNFRPWFDIPMAFLGEILIFVGLATYSLMLFKVAGLRVPEQPIVELFGRSATGFVLAVVFVAILAPIGEEVFFRGFVYTAFRKRWGVARALILSSLVFAIFHVVPLLYTPMFIIGMILATLFEYRRSLAPNIILHGLNNFLALVIVYWR